MKRDDRLAHLVVLSGLVSDATSLRLRQAQAARDAVQAQIKAIEDGRLAKAPQDSGQAMVAHAYDMWASRRLATLNLDLARRQADVLTQGKAARQAFGRARAIEALNLRQPQPRRD